MCREPSQCSRSRTSSVGGEDDFSKKEVGAKGLLFDWAIGWLARKDKIVITQKKRFFTIRVK